MKKKFIFLLFSLLLFTGILSVGQNPELQIDSGFVKKPVFISVLNLRPVTLNKQRILFSIRLNTLNSTNISIPKVARQSGCLKVQS